MTILESVCDNLGKDLRNGEHMIEVQGTVRRVGFGKIDVVRNARPEGCANQAQKIPQLNFVFGTAAGKYPVQVRHGLDMCTDRVQQQRNFHGIQWAFLSRETDPLEAYVTGQQGQVIGDPVVGLEGAGGAGFVSEFSHFGTRWFISFTGPGAIAEPLPGRVHRTLRTALQPVNVRLSPTLRSQVFKRH